MYENEQTLISKGEIIPAYTLPGPDGWMHNSWDYRQCEHLLVVISQSLRQPEARKLALDLAENIHRFREEKCQINLITPDPVVTNLQVQEELHLPFLLLADPQGGTIERYTQWEAGTKTFAPTIVLANLYTALYQQWTAGAESELPELHEPLSDLEYLNRLCSI